MLIALSVNVGAQTTSTSRGTLTPEILEHLKNQLPPEEYERLVKELATQKTSAAATAQVDEALQSELKKADEYDKGPILRGSVLGVVDDVKDYVDTLLTLSDPQPLAVGGKTWNILYSESLRRARPETNAMGDPKMRRVTDKQGKTITYKVYDSPNIYYVIADLPANEGRYYGLITCGYDPIQTVLSKEKKAWHPLTRVEPVQGTIVMPDGSRKELNIHSDDEWAKANLKQPAGSYWALNSLGAKKLNLTFNPGGTGSMTIYGYTKEWNLELVQAESIGGQRNSYTGRMRKGARDLSGGYTVWMTPVGKRAFKWKLNADGEIEITPTGAATGSHEEGISENQQGAEQYYASKSEEQTHKAQQRNDFKNQNEEAREARKEMNSAGKEAAEAFGAFKLKPQHISRKEMLADYNGATLYFTSAQPDPNDPYQTKLYGTLGSMRSYTANRRSFGAETILNNYKMDAKRAVAAHPEIFGNNPQFEVYDIDIKTGKARLIFISENTYKQGKLHIDRKGRFDTEAFKSSLLDYNELPKLQEKIEELNSQIMSYKSDKRKKKIVGNYEKGYKNFVKQERNFSTYRKYVLTKNDLEKFIKEQEKTLDLLK